MNIKEILNILFKHLDKNLQKNQSLIKVKDTFLHVIEEVETPYYITINESLYDLIEEFHDHITIVPIPYSETVIFEISSHGVHDIDFVLRKINDYYYVNFATSIQNINGFFDSINIDIVINNETTTWKIEEVSTDSNGYYESYNGEIHSFNKNSEELKLDNIEEINDKNFSEFFGVPLELSREYRLNFEKYKKEINNYYIQKQINRVDELYKDNTLFVPPFFINELSDYLIKDYEEELKSEQEDEDHSLDEEYEEEAEILSFNKVKKRAEYIQNELIKRTGSRELFTMTYNFYLNLSTFLFLNNEKLNTKGIILRKLEDKYTIYYIYLENKGIMLMPKSLTDEEVESLYNSSKQNKTIIGINEFFNKAKKRKLKPNDNQ